jgi:hypothetical protein
MWKILGLLFALGLGIPILNMVYQGFTNSTNGTITTGNVTTTACTTGVPLATGAEIALWQLMTVILALIIIGFLFALIGGKFQKQ